MKKLIIILIISLIAGNCFASDWFEGGKAWDGTYVFGSFYLQRYFRAFGMDYVSSVTTVTFLAVSKELIADELYKERSNLFPKWWGNIGDKRGKDIRDIGLSLIGSALLTIPIEIKLSTKNILFKLSYSL